MLNWFLKKKKLKILIIEDQDDDALLAITRLRRAGYAVAHERVDTLAALETALRTEWDIVLADHAMPTMSGIEALRKVRQLDAVVPFIFVSGTLDEELAVEAIRMGAQDYVLKSKLDRLVPIVQRELQESRVRSERGKAERQTDYLAQHNSLTGLPNRFHFLEFVDRQLAGSRRKRLLVVVVYIRLERFRSIDESLGYEAGIKFLQEVSGRLYSCLPRDGFVARLSIDEFSVVHRSLKSHSNAEGFVRRLFEVMEKPYSISSFPMYSSAAVGVAVYPDNAFTARDLLQKAQIAGLQVKDREGRGVLFFESEMSEDLDKRLEIQRAMRDSIERRELYLNFQPQLEMATGRICALEILLRWCHRERGIVCPATFLPLAEENGFIFLIGEWVLRESFRQLKLWEYAGIPSVNIAINICPRQFHEDNLANLLMQMLDEYAVDSKRLTVELTEPAFTRDPEKAKSILMQLRKHSIKVAVSHCSDRSSHTYFSEFPVDYIKVGSINALATPGRLDAIAEVIQAARSHSIKVIAECVETEEQHRVLKSMGCDFVQGFYVGKPADATVIRGLLARQA